MAELPKTADVVVIGGGCTGASVAYHLARMGAKVALIEKNALASGSTGHAAGLITQQFATEMHVRLAKESLAFFEDLAGEKSLGLKFHQHGYVHLLFASAELEEARRQVALQRRLGVDSQILSAAAVRDLVPSLRVEDVLGAMYCARDGYTDPHLATTIFADLAKEHGAAVVQWTEVTAVEAAKGRVMGVRTDGGRVLAPVVVDAAGPWAALVAETAGIDLPVRPFRRMLWFTRPFDRVPDNAPVLFDTHHDFYFRREGEGLLMCLGNPGEPSNFDTTLDWSFAPQVAEYATYRFPPFEEAALVSGWAAPRDITPDHEPVLGEVPGLEGFVAAAGHSGHGFMLSPAIGRAIAQLILLRRSSIDIGPLSIERFRGRELPIDTYRPIGT
ncbi:MAG: FAD-binding oxidoreductase [Chloroflexi bacterium]|nr:FAD-binding oxidoreductase [Chloroflexota bacterium]